MPYFIALVGFIILSGGTAPAQLSDNASSTTSKIAVADPVHMERPASPTSYMVKLTSYNAVPEQTDSTPFTTSIGAYSNPEVVAARSSDLSAKLPYGTIIAIEGPDADTANCNYHKVSHLIGYRIIADAMDPRITNTVDVLLDQTDTVIVDGKEMNPSRALGLCHGVTIRVIGRIDKKDFPKTQEGLVNLIKAGQLAMR
jgi:3D (Asp-Asp-Asp) domain-containing protein